MSYAPLIATAWMITGLSVLVVFAAGRQFDWRSPGHVLFALIFTLLFWPIVILLIRTRSRWS